MNTLTGLFQTLILPAVADLNQPLMFKNSMLSRIYSQEQPVSGTVGQTVNVNIPVVNENDAIDIGSGPIQISDGDHTTVPMVINNNKSWSRRIPKFDKIRTPMDFKQFYLEPGIESLKRRINRQVCNLATPTNFSSYTSITAGADVFTRPNIAQAWSNLVGAGVPDQFSFVTSHIPYSNMIGDDANKWITESIVGRTAAEAAQQQAKLMPAFGADISFDQQFPVPGAGTYAGLFFNKNAMAFIPVAPDPDPRPNVETTTYTPEGTGLIFNIEFWYDPREQAYIIHIHCMFALTVVRPNFGSYLVTT